MTSPVASATDPAASAACAAKAGVPVSPGDPPSSSADARASSTAPSVSAMSTSAARRRTRLGRPAPAAPIAVAIAARAAPIFPLREPEQREPGLGVLAELVSTSVRRLGAGQVALPPTDLGQLQEGRRRDPRFDRQQLLACPLGLRRGLRPRARRRATSARFARHIPGYGESGGSSSTTPPPHRSTRRRVAGRRSPDTLRASCSR